jgi:predicted nucleic acid-binding protein
MSGDRVFVDTNVLVYAHDASAGSKRDQAAALIRSLWDSGDGCLSIQVLQEFFVTVTRKVPQPLAIDEAAGLVSELSQWNVHSPGADDVLGAIDLHARTAVPFWDAMIIRSAAKLGCGLLYSEDLSDGQRYHGVEVCNPFNGTHPTDS